MGSVNQVTLTDKQRAWALAFVDSQMGDLSVTTVARAAATAAATEASQIHARYEALAVSYDELASMLDRPLWRDQWAAVANSIRKVARQ